MDTPQQPSASGSHKALWIVGIIVVVLIIGGWGVMAAVRGVSKAVVENGTSGSIQGEDGSSVQWGTNKLPDGWPSDVTVYSGSTIQYSGSSNPTTGTAGAAVIFQTNDSAQKVADFYKTDLTAKGWNINGTYQAGTTTTLGATKDDRTLAISIASSDNMTIVTMGVETKAQ